MRLDDFKLSVNGMRLDNQLYLRTNDVFLPIVDTDINDECCYLIVGSKQAEALTLSRLTELKGDLMLYGRDDLQKIWPVYGYRVVDNRLVLG